MPLKPLMNTICWLSTNVYAQYLSSHPFLLVGCGDSAVPILKKFI